MVGRYDWFYENTDGRQTRFVIKRNTQTLLNMIKIYLIALFLSLGCICLGIIMWELGSGMMSLFSILLVPSGIFLGIMSFVLMLSSSGIYLITKSKGIQEFIIEPQNVLLIQGYKRYGYPSMIQRSGISEFYVRPPLGTGIIMFVQFGSFLDLLSKNEYGVALNYRGAEVIITASLTKEESNYLFSRIEYALTL